MQKNVKDKMCSKKKRFAIPSKAWEAARKLKKVKKLDLFVYGCPHCAGYHLTRLKKRF